MNDTTHTPDDAPDIRIGDHVFVRTRDRGRDRTGAGRVVEVDHRKGLALVKLFGHRGARRKPHCTGDVWAPLDALSVRKSKRRDGAAGRT